MKADATADGYDRNRALERAYVSKAASTITSDRMPRDHRDRMMRSETRAFI